MTLRSPRAQEPTSLPILVAPMGEHPGPEQQHPLAPPLQLPAKPAPCPSPGSPLRFAPPQRSGAPSIGGSTQRPWSGLLGEHSDLLGYKQPSGRGPSCLHAQYRMDGLPHEWLHHKAHTLAWLGLLLGPPGFPFFPWHHFWCQGTKVKIVEEACL